MKTGLPFVLLTADYKNLMDSYIKPHYLFYITLFFIIVTLLLVTITFYISFKKTKKFNFNLYSAFAIYMEVKSYNQYSSKKNIMSLFLAALSEPFVFHPFLVWSGIKGYVDKLRKKSGWGEMTRQGLNGNQQKNLAAFESENAAVIETSALQEAVASASVTPHSATKEKVTFLQRLRTGVQEAAVYTILLTGAMMLIKMYELARNIQLHGTPQSLTHIIEIGLLNELSFVLSIAILPSLIFIVIYLFHKNTARFLFVLFSVLLVIIQAALSEYFLETLVPLGGDLWNYSLTEIKQTIGAAGSITVTTSLLALCMAAGAVFFFTFIPQKLKLGFTLSVALLILCITGVSFSVASVTNELKPGQEFSNNLALNKSYYFYKSSLELFYSNHPSDIKPAEDNSKHDFHYVDEKNYPFLHTIDTSADVLSPFFYKSETPPNVVFIVVEGLGRAFSNKDAYLGSFTPFLDSLSDKSLYWSNFLSTAGRTFAVLPSVFGSLPYAKNGFLELADHMPQHLSLLSLLKKEGYKTSFYYGGNASFDRMSDFLKMNGTTVYDQKTFSSAYQPMPSSAQGFSWGFGDEEVFRKYNEVNSGETRPSCSVVLTLSTHSPFLINNEDKYLNLFEQRMQSLGFNDIQKEEHRHYRSQYASILYMDNAVRNFIDSFAKRTDFGNTIFIITGDHRMPEIPMSTKIDRYHVPLIIYSPLLKQNKHFASVSSHLDITPSLISFLAHQYHFFMPSQATWLGSGLDTSATFRNIHSYPLMQTKNEINDYVMDDYLLNGDDLYKISNNMNLDPIADEAQKNKLKNAFAKFRQKNNRLINGAHLQP